MTFDSFLKSCASDSVNARYYCETCREPSDTRECIDCSERRERREARNDAGADEA